MQLQDWVGLQEGEGTQLGGEGAAEVRPGTQEGGEEIAAGEISPDLYRFVQCDIKKRAFDSLKLEQNP